MGFPGDSAVKHLPASAGDRGSISGSERSLGEMAIYSSSLAWEISWMEDLAGYSAKGDKRIGNNLATNQQEQEANS